MLFRGDGPGSSLTLLPLEQAQHMQPLQLVLLLPRLTTHHVMPPLQLMLLQSDPDPATDKIYLLPAWPASLDVEFKLQRA